MKKILLLSLTFLSAKSFGLVGQSLTCSWSTITHHHRKVFIPYDQLQVRGSKDLATPFLEKNEDSDMTMDAVLVLIFAPGRCNIDPLNQSVIATCSRSSVTPQPDFDHSEIVFTQVTKSASGQDQIVTISRSIEVISANLTMNLIDAESILDRKPTKRVISEIEVVARVAGEIRTLKMTLNEGEWTDRTDRSNGDRCVFSPAGTN
ncbi:MAG: hypothetical protein ACK5P6_02695 [Pseudobdellovibrionaceae bacterium]